MFGFIAISSKEPAKNEKLEYYEVVEYFHNSQVTAYELNIGTGALKMELADGTSVKYTVPNVTLFVDDVHESVVEFNKANPKKAIKYNYVSGASYDFWLQLIPIAITVVMLILLASLGDAVFLILMVILKNLLFKPVLNVMDSRKEKIDVCCQIDTMDSR